MPIENVNGEVSGQNNVEAPEQNNEERSDQNSVEILYQNNEEKPDKRPRDSEPSPTSTERSWLDMDAHGTLIICWAVGATAGGMCVVVGSSYITDAAGGQMRRVAKVWSHPRYNSPTHHDNDVAVLRLKRPVMLNNRTRSAPLPPAGWRLPDDAPLTLLGWGVLYVSVTPSTSVTRSAIEIRREQDGFLDILKYLYTSSFQSGSKAPSAVLRHVVVLSISRSKCNELYRLYPAQADPITDNMFCGGILDGGGKGVPERLRRAGVVRGVVVGVTSWGAGCADAHHPGVSARKNYNCYELEKCEKGKKDALSRIATSSQKSVKSEVKQMSFQECVDKTKQWDNKSVKSLAVDKSIKRVIRHILELLEDSQAGAPSSSRSPNSKCARLDKTDDSGEKKPLSLKDTMTSLMDTSDSDIEDEDDIPLNWIPKSYSSCEKQRYGLLSPIARQCLVTPPTSVPSERMFSGAGIIYTRIAIDLKEKKLRSFYF
ncbi:Trypsin [Eumeta japonica]|uniref:Trypsin n=1 Tax=Eumeta variegata TaxID=151549 RepID=A0A4C1SFK0_EUMVA|nr:Trypsin [Eumeta japonica]